jgi:hypothetical protein
VKRKQNGRELDKAEAWALIEELKRRQRELEDALRRKALGEQVDVHRRER